MSSDTEMLRKANLLCVNGCNRYKQGNFEVCNACYLRERRNTPEGKRKYKDSWLQKLYGITIEDFEDMLIAQEYKCGICDSEISLFGNKTNVDHCHATDRVRGLLCSSCNTLIALAKDSEKILLNAISYLKR